MRLGFIALLSRVFGCVLNLNLFLPVWRRHQFYSMPVEIANDSASAPLRVLGGRNDIDIQFREQLQTVVNRVNIEADPSIRRCPGFIRQRVDLENESARFRCVMLRPLAMRMSFEQDSNCLIKRDCTFDIWRSNDEKVWDWRSSIHERDNGNDHRAGTIDLNIEKHAQVRLRVHRIVILRRTGKGRVLLGFERG